MAMLPRPCVASRALRIKLINAFCNWLPSRRALRGFESSWTRSLIASGNDRRTSLSTVVTILLMSTTLVSTGCLREKDSKPLINSEPRRAASIAGSMYSVACILADGSSARAVRLPSITVRMLLKSCASPPVNWPNASIFWAWAINSCERRWSVMSNVNSKQPATVPSAATSGIKVVRATRLRPSTVRTSYSKVTASPRSAWVTWGLICA